MSEIQVPAQVSASSYRAPVEPALSLKSELESYDRDKDRRSLLCALKEQVTGTPVPVSETPMVSIQQEFRVPVGGSQPSLADASASNLVKDLLVAHERIIAPLHGPRKSHSNAPPNGCSATAASAPGTSKLGQSERQAAHHPVNTMTTRRRWRGFR